MFSKAWDSRIAAGWAIESLAKNVSFNVDEDPSQPLSSEALDEKDLLANAENFLNFENFDIENVCLKGISLLGSSGEEYDFGLSQTNSKEILSMQRRALKQKLGLSTHFMDGDIIGDSDIIGLNQSNNGGPSEQQSNQHVSTKSGSDVAGAVKKGKQGEDVSNMLLSARERNRIKRKMRMAEREKQLAAQRYNFFSFLDILASELTMSFAIQTRDFTRWVRFGHSKR